MKHLLINGCSYSVWWSNYEELAQRLHAEKSVNLGMNGASNDRIFRTTVNYIIKNPDVDFVILMTSFMNRYEGPWGVIKEPYEGHWVSYSPQRLTGVNYERVAKDEPELHRINKFIDDKFMVDLIRNNHAYVDKFFTNLIQLAGWLDSKNIKYCIFNSCESLIRHNLDMNILDKDLFETLAQNKRIIDLKNFISNQYMYEQGANIRDEERAMFESIGLSVSPEWAHYGKDGYDILNDFLYNYITTNCL